MKTLRELIPKDKPLDLVGIGLISAFLTLPIQGFVFGFIASKEEDGTPIGWSIFIGFVYVFLNILGLGRPDLDEGGVRQANLRPWIIPTFLSIFIVLWLCKTFIIKRRS